MHLAFQPVVLPDDAAAAVDFLTSDEWPFHGTPRLSAEAAAAMTLVSDDTCSFWIRADGHRVGLLRAFDLDDLATGSPLFDIRIASAARGRGIGRAAVTWLTDHLFSAHPQLWRIEATTRHDNLAMQAVFAAVGYRQEGRLVEAWTNADGTRADALVYAVLRRERPS